ncbi:MAG: hypothetical protein AAGK04_07275 [Planctomycetota bacterium]
MDLIAWIEVSTRLGLLIGAIMVLVWLFRTIRLPGGRPACSILAGVLAGLLLGPGVFGVLAPPHYQRLMEGAVAQRLDLELTRAGHESALDALRRTGVSPIAIDELASAQRAETARAERRLAAAHAERRRTAAIVAMALLAPLLASLLLVVGRVKERAAFSRGGEVNGVLAGLGSGIVSGLVAGLSTLVLLRWLLDLPLLPAAGVAGAVVGGALLHPLPMRWRPLIARGAAARWFAHGLTLVAFVGVGAAIGVGPMGWWWAVLFVPWFGAWAMPASEDEPWFSTRRARAVVRVIVLWLALPLVVAETTVRLEPTQLLAGGPGPIVLVLIACLACGAGHFIGAWLGLMTFAIGPPRDESTRFTLEAFMASGPATSVVFCFVLVATNVVDPASHPGAAATALVLLNALALELQLDFARPLARAFDRGGT